MKMLLRHLSSVLVPVWLAMSPWLAVLVMPVAAAEVVPWESSVLAELLDQMEEVGPSESVWSMY